MRHPVSLLVATLVAFSATNWGCSGRGCTLIGCSQEGYEIFFDSDSHWGQGVHTIDLSWSPRGSKYNSHYARCQIYPYFSGRNAECDPIVANSAQTYVSDQSLRILAHPELLHILIADERGWSMKHTIDPEYDVTYPNGRGCDDGCEYGSTTLTLDGPGEVAGYVQDLYPGADPYVEPGAGGMGGSLSGENSVGSRCEENQDCALPGFCFSHFLGGAGLCTQSCLDDADCPTDSVCTSNLIDDSFERIDGYCMQPCSDVPKCEPLDSRCNVQDAGHFCF